MDSLFLKKDTKIKCSHNSTKVIELPNDSAHWGKNVCVDCNKWISWVKNPNITKIAEERDTMITSIINNNPNLDPKHLSYLYSIKGKRFISPKQQQYYDGIIKIKNLIIGNI
jgi:hypothetical protein